MNVLRRHVLTFLVAATTCAPLAIASPTLLAQSSSQQPDNSSQNQNQNQGKTADTQSNAKADRLTTASVRKAIIADKDLSLYAHNIKIITRNGAVTLKGPVKSEEEKQKVMTDAASVVNQDKVVDHITVKQ